MYYPYIVILLYINVAYCSRFFLYCGHFFSLRAIAFLLWGQFFSLLAISSMIFHLKTLLRMQYYVY